LVTVGAGGGSIAWLDPAGYPKVGPQSAGARPGPACYGWRGTEPTITDANLLLGRLTADRQLAGGLVLHEELAVKAIRHLSSSLGLSPEQTAAGIIRIANSNMAKGIRVKTVERGLDPRVFSLVAFGGAGPLHAADIAVELEIPEVVIPEHPGV